MPPKRAQVPPEVFAKRPSALDKLTGTAPDGDTVLPQNGDTVMMQNGNTVIRQEGNTASPPTRPTKAAGEKTTFYLRADQLDKLDELVLAYKRRTGTRINRNDIVRQLIDGADLEALIGDA